MIKDYRIASGENATALAVRVVSQLSLGWQPYGDPFFVDGLFYQTLVKKED